MENGNKRKYIIGILILIVGMVIGITVYTLSGDKVSFDASNVSFFESLLSRTEEGKVEVLSLDAYYKDGYHYYNVVFKTYDYDIEAMNTFNVVYFGNYDIIMR